MKIYSTHEVKLLECVGPNEWRVRWDKQKLENMYSYEERGFNYKPSFEEIQELIISYYNSKTENKIINDLVWDKKEIYLSKENQMNYQMYYNSLISGDLNFPLRIKLKNNSYIEFNSITIYRDFYASILRHINKCLQEGWSLKDNINWEEYE